MRKIAQPQGPEPDRGPTARVELRGAGVVRSKLEHPWRAQKNLADPFSPPSLLGPRSWLLPGRLCPQTPDRPPPTSRRGGQRPRAVHRNSWPRSSTDRRGAFAAARSHSSASRVGSRSVGSDSKSELARGRDLEVTANRIEVTAKWWANHARSCEGSTLSCPTGQRSSLCRPISVPARTSLRSM